MTQLIEYIVLIGIVGIIFAILGMTGLYIFKNAAFYIVFYIGLLIMCMGFSLPFIYWFKKNISKKATPVIGKVSENVEK